MAVITFCFYQLIHVPDCTDQQAYLGVLGMILGVLLPQTIFFISVNKKMGQILSTEEETQVDNIPKHQKYMVTEQIKKSKGDSLRSKIKLKKSNKPTTFFYTQVL